MDFQSSLNIVGLATTAVAACLMLLFPRVAGGTPPAAERVPAPLPSARSRARSESARPRWLPIFAAALLVVGFLFQLVAALSPTRTVEPPTAEEAAAAASPAPPTGCEAAGSAEECADILARSGKNPFAAYGVVGRMPVYRRRVSTAAASTPRVPAARDAPERTIPADSEATAPTGLVLPPASIAYSSEYIPIEQFGLEVVYGLVRVLNERGTARWMLFEYNIGTYDHAVRATYAAQATATPIDVTQLSRITSFICGVAAARPDSQLGQWSVELLFREWDRGVSVSGPFIVRRSDCH